MNKFDEFFGFGNWSYLKDNKFAFSHTNGEDSIILDSPLVSRVWGNKRCLIVGKSDIVYLKDWQIRRVHNEPENRDTYLIKLDRKYAKVYHYDADFEKDGSHYDGPEVNDFDDMYKIAENQEKYWYSECVGA